MMPSTNIKYIKLPLMDFRNYKFQVSFYK